MFNLDLALLHDIEFISKDFVSNGKLPNTFSNCGCGGGCDGCNPCTGGV